LSGLPLPGSGPTDNLVRGTALSRLAAAFRADAEDSPAMPEATFSSSPAGVVGARGVPNPYGTGLSAYEPNTVLFSDYETAYNASQQSKLEEAASAQMLTADFSQPGMTGGGGGVVSGVPYADLFNAAAAKYGLPAGLLAAVARAESGFNPSARSPAGALGLMQFMPATASGMGVNPMDPASAIDGAARYLRQNLDRFGSIPLALAAYNAGPGAVAQYGGIPPYAETQTYVSRVQSYMAGYGSSLTSNPSSSASQGGAVDFAGGGLAGVQATGKLGAMVSAAMGLATRRVPYVWGGTTANGVDCSGLIYYAARAAGITTDKGPWPRFRAVDYGRMGTAVSLSAARPGDIVYYDNPGDVDHVGIYIGNGQMIQAPQSGDVVKVTGVGNFTSIRRVFTDGAYTAGATPSGGAIPLYNGMNFQPTRIGTGFLSSLPQSLPGYTSGPPVIRRTTGPMRAAV
jgi:soluble lytic murein transglycosylase-like protein